MLLEGKNAIITGSRRGIGRATVEVFAQNGANVWACARKQDDAFEADMAALAERYGVWIKPIYFDVTDDATVCAGVKSILAGKLPLNILVNNAGMYHADFLQMTSIDTLRKVFDVNYFAPLRLIQLLTRPMMRQNGGVIVNLSSVAGIIGRAGCCAYGGSKAALAFATKSLAQELAPYGIRVNAVAPGLSNTDMGAQMKDVPRQEMLAGCALRRLAEPLEIAKAIAFLASEDASFITGQILRVDGGM